MSDPTLVHVLAAVGVAAVVVAQEAGPGAAVRERVLRPALLVVGAAARQRRVDGVLDCMVCASIWAGVGVGLACGLGWGALLVSAGAAAVVWGVMRAGRQ